FDILISLVVITNSSVHLVGNTYNSNNTAADVLDKSVDIITIILYTMVIFTAIVMVIGAIKKQPQALKPWMITKLFLITIGGVLQIIYLCIVISKFHNKSVTFVMLMELSTIIQIALGFYMIFAVTRFYSILVAPKDESEEVHRPEIAAT
uniref:Uncharacterized protein n=1 Tax=Megaselia scalaris TaxID=36166 RepID=T1GSP6_MEGSC